MRKKILSRWLPVMFAIVTTIFIQPQESRADILYDMIPEPGDFGLFDFDHFGTLTRDGVTAKFTGHSDVGLFGILGKIDFSANSFGVSIADATDQDATLIDGGNSDSFGFVAEQMLISFDQAVTLDEITLRFLGDGAVARLSDPDNATIVFSELNGSVSEFDTYDLSSQNLVLAAGESIGLKYVNGSGFGLKSLRVSAVPEPSSIFVVAMTSLVLGMRRRRHR